MGPVPVIIVQPWIECGPAVVQSWIGGGVSPFAQGRLDEAFGLAVGFGRVGPGTDVPQFQCLAGVAEGAAAIAGAIIGHHARHGDAEAAVIGEGGMEEGGRAFLLLVGPDLAEGDARGIVDTDMDELPADTAAVRLAMAVAGDAVADARSDRVS